VINLSSVKDIILSKAKRELALIENYMALEVMLLMILEEDEAS